MCAYRFEGASEGKKKKKKEQNCDMHLTVWGQQYDVITKPHYIWQRFAVLGNNYCVC